MRRLLSAFALSLAIVLAAGLAPGFALASNGGSLTVGSGTLSAQAVEWDVAPDGENPGYRIELVQTKYTIALKGANTAHIEYKLVCDQQADNVFYADSLAEGGEQIVAFKDMSDNEFSYDDGKYVCSGWIEYTGLKAGTTTLDACIYVNGRAYDIQTITLTVANAETSDDAGKVTPDTKFNLWVGGVQVTGANASDVKGAGISGKVSYDYATATLTLNNATITGDYWIVNNGDGAYGSYWKSLSKYGIYQPSGDKLTIRLVGTNEINIDEESWENGFEYLFGISGTELVFTGSGTLSIVNDFKYANTGIECGPMTIDAGATVKVASSAWSYDSTGVAAGKLTVKGTLETSADSGTQYAKALAVHKDVTVAKSGKLIATAAHGNCGMDAILVRNDGALNVNGYVKAWAAVQRGGVSEDASGVFCGTLSVGSTGEVEAYGVTKALSTSKGVKLGSKNMRVLTGTSASDATAVSASKIGSSKYVRILMPKANPMTVTAKTVKFKLAKVQKKAQYVNASKAFTVKKNQGKVTYKVQKYLSKSAEKYVKVAKNGKVTVKKGAEKGTYALKVKVTDAGTPVYKAKSKTVKLVVKVA